MYYTISAKFSELNGRVLQINHDDDDDDDDDESASLVMTLTTTGIPVVPILNKKAVLSHVEPRDADPDAILPGIPRC